MPRWYYSGSVPVPVDVNPATGDVKVVRPRSYFYAPEAAVEAIRVNVKRVGPDPVEAPSVEVVEAPVVELSPAVEESPGPVVEEPKAVRVPKPRKIVERTEDTSHE